MKVSISPDSTDSSRIYEIVLTEDHIIKNKISYPLEKSQRGGFAEEELPAVYLFETKMDSTQTFESEPCR
jgi:hypothetical protein